MPELETITLSNRFASYPLAVKSWARRIEHIGRDGWVRGAEMIERLDEPTPEQRAPRAVDEGA